MALFVAMAGVVWAQSNAENDTTESAATVFEPGPRPYRIWSRQEYSGGPVVMSISHHPTTGFMYLGTGRGVSEYDGVRWHPIDPPDRGPTRGAVIDERGRIWTGRYNGVFLLAPDATGQLQLLPQTELLPPELREIGYVRQVTNTPMGICFAARQNVIVISPDGKLRSWRAEEPFYYVWWMNGALHASITNRGMFRFDDGGAMTKLHGDMPVVLAARAREDDTTLLLTSRGPLVWHADEKKFETPAGYGDFFAKNLEVTAAAFLRDGRAVCTLENADLAMFDQAGTPLLVWPKVPTLAFNYCRQFAEDAEGGLWLAKHAGVIRIQLDPVPAADPPLRVMVRRVSEQGGRILYSAGGDRPVPTEVSPTVDVDGLRIEFAAPSYRHERQGGDKLLFRSRLDGVDADWTPWTEEGARELIGLPMRALTLKIEARRPSEIASAAATMVLKLHRTWWRTRWALAMFVGSGGALLLGAHRLGTRALRNRAGRLEAQIAARTTELAEKNTVLAEQNRELAALRQLDLDEKIAARLAEEKARLEVLRYQLNPHFLYNTLNSLYSLVLTAPPAAADMVLRLADFCRLALERQDEETTTVGSSFDALVLYLEIEKIRWGPSLRVEVTVDAEARAAFLPPFLVLPLVENAIKYGGATSPEELRVRLSARLVSSADGQRRVLEIEVANTGQWVSSETSAARGSTGIGLENLRQRLDRYYPGQHQFAADTTDGWVRVILRIEKWDAPIALVHPPIEKNAAAAAEV